MSQINRFPGKVGIAKIDVAALANNGEAIVTLPQGAGNFFIVQADDGVDSYAPSGSTFSAKLTAEDAPPAQATVPADGITPATAFEANQDFQGISPIVPAFITFKNLTGGAFTGSYKVLTFGV